MKFVAEVKKLIYLQKVIHVSVQTLKICNFLPKEISNFKELLKEFCLRVLKFSFCFLRMKKVHNFKTWWFLSYSTGTCVP